MAEPYFGNPTNPFDQPPLDPCPGYYNYGRDTASEVVFYMSTFAHSVTIEPIDDQLTARSISINCTAPYIAEYKLFNTGADPAIRVFTPQLPKVPIRLVLADVLQANRITSRSVTMSRSNGEPFGVTAVSREVAEGEYEHWRALKMLIEPTEDEITASLLAQPEDTDSSGDFELLTEQTPQQNFKGFYSSISLAIHKTRLKRMAGR